MSRSLTKSVVNACSGVLWGSGVSPRHNLLLPNIRVCLYLFLTASSGLQLQLQSQTPLTPLIGDILLTSLHLTLLRSNLLTTCSLDPIPSTPLQADAPTLIPAITQINNTSLTTGTFPTSFKQAKITPLLKKPSFDPSLVEIKHVSILLFVAKTLERAVFNKFSDFWEIRGHHWRSTELHWAPLSQEHADLTPTTLEISEYTTQLIVQVLVTSHPDCCDALFIGSPACTIKPFKII